MRDEVRDQEYERNNEHRVAEVSLEPPIKHAASSRAIPVHDHLFLLKVVPVNEELEPHVAPANRFLATTPQWKLIPMLSSVLFAPASFTSVPVAVEEGILIATAFAAFLDFTCV